MADDIVERCLLVKPEVFVYNIPPRYILISNQDHVINDDVTSCFSEIPQEVTEQPTGTYPLLTGREGSDAWPRGNGWRSD